MKRFALALLLTCCFSLALLAEEPVIFKLGPSDEETAIIVEFHEPPLLARPRSREAAQALESLFDRLARDLAQIDSRVTAQAEPRTLRHRYQWTFAGASARVRRDSLAAIRALPYVKAVHIDQKMEAHLDKSVPLIGAPKVWEELGARGRGVTVAVLDTGIDYRHPSLGKGFGNGFKVAGGWDFVNNDADPIDDHGHGTHVAGIVAGNEAPVIGVAPDATLIAFKVLNKEGGGEESTIVAAVERTVDPDGNGDLSDRVDIVNMSLGGPGLPDSPLVQAVERATAAGVVFAISAGNSRYNGTIRIPGLAPSAITVGATDRDDNATIFTSRGPIGGSWAFKPEVAAPGDGIRSARLRSGTVFASGTSMAAPHIAGVAALVLELHPNWTPQDVKAAIVSTAQPKTESDGTIGILATGAGRVEARSAVAATVLPTPVGLTFGVVPRRGESFSATRTLRLTNRGSATETLTIRANNLPIGAKITVTPAEVTITPGNIAEVTVTLALDKATPEATEHNIGLTGRLELTGTSTLQVPWFVVAGDVISVTYDGGSDDFEIAVFGSARPSTLWQEGPRTFGAFAFWQADIAVFDPQAPGGAAMIIREMQPMNGYTHVTLTPADAKHTITIAGVDERGVPLAELAADERNTSVITQHFMLSSMGRIIFELSNGHRSYRISPLTKTPIRTYEALLTPSARYASMHIQNTVEKDETIAISASQWAGQAIETRCKTNCRVIFGAGIGSPAGLSFRFYELPPGAATWKLFLTETASQEFAFRSHLYVMETDVPREDTSLNSGWTYASPSIYNTGGRIALAPFNRLIPLVDYRAPHSDSPVSFGDGPVVLRTILNDFLIYIDPYGPLGSSFADNIRNVQVSRYDAAGNPSGLIPHPSSLYFYRIPRGETPGVYRLEMTDQYPVGGRTGQLKQTSVYDTRIYDESNVGPPSLSMLHIETAAGVVTSTVSAGSAPRLVFGARESTWYPRANAYIRHRLIDSAKTQVWWRRHGTTEWQPLPITMIGTDNEHYAESPGSPGNVFSASLRDTTAMEGAIDLKFNLVADHGATTEVVYEPAFVVGPQGSGKRRAAGH